MRYIKATKTKTGQAAKRRKQWQWSNQMEVFRPFMSFAKTSSNVAEISECRNSIDTNETNDTQTSSSGEDMQSQFLDQNYLDDQTQETVSEDPAVTDVLEASSFPAPTPINYTNTPSSSTSNPSRSTNYSANKKKLKVNSLHP